MLIVLPFKNECFDRRFLASILISGTVVGSKLLYEVSILKRSVGGYRNAISYPGDAILSICPRFAFLEVLHPLFARTGPISTL